MFDDLLKNEYSCNAKCLIITNLKKDIKMKTENYPKIGSLVSYLRADDEGTIIEGHGNVMAIFLDPRNRLMVRVKDGENDWNVDYIGINWDETTRQAYQNTIDQVQVISKEGNELVKKTVESYNQQVEECYSASLGEPVELETNETKH